MQDCLAILVQHFAKVGKALENSVEAYNMPVGSLETRVLPAARRFNELGAGGAKEIGVLEPIAQAPRALLCPSFSTSTKRLQGRSGTGRDDCFHRNFVFHRLVKVSILMKLLDGCFTCSYSFTEW